MRDKQKPTRKDWRKRIHLLAERAEEEGSSSYEEAYARLMIGQALAGNAKAALFVWNAVEPIG